MNNNLSNKYYMNLEDKPTTISITSNGRTIIVTDDNPYPNIEEMQELLRAVLLGAGWLPSQVNDIMNIENE